MSKERYDVTILKKGGRGEMGKMEFTLTKDRVTIGDSYTIDGIVFTVTNLIKEDE